MTPAYTQLFTDLSAICRRPELSRQQMLNHSLALICQHTHASRAAILAPAAETLPTIVVASTPQDWSLTKPVEFETYPWLVTDGPAGQPVLGYFNLSDPAGVRWGVLGVEADRQDFFSPDCVEALVTVTPLLAGILQPSSDNKVPVLASANLARISHHLRGPLNAMVGHARIQAQLESIQSGDNTSQSGTRAILKSALSLTASVETIMDYAWLQLGAFPLAFRSLDPTEIVAATVSLAADLLDGKPVRFNTIVAPDLPAVCADARAVRHILHNLIGNAIRFTERGEITLGLRPTTGGVHFDLQDTGRGLTPEQTAQVFSAFNNLDEGGLGLGLYVTRQLLVRHGTALTVSGQPGQGARFGFTLKAANRAQQAARRPLLWILSDSVEAAWWSDLLTREYCFVISDGQSLRSNYSALSPDAILIDLTGRGASRQALIDLAMLECAAPIAVIASGTLLVNEYRELGATAIGESPLSLIEALLDHPNHVEW